jgi:hypothetical protein
MTQMVGLKYKIAHKSVGKVAWNASRNAQKKHLIEILKSLIAEMEANPEQLTPIPLKLEYKNDRYEGTAIPVPAACEKGACFDLDITLNKKHIGIIRRAGDKWKITELKSQGLANAIGSQITEWYEKAA